MSDSFIIIVQWLDLRLFTICCAVVPPPPTADCFLVFTPTGGTALLTLLLRVSCYRLYMKLTWSLEIWSTLAFLLRVLGRMLLLLAAFGLFWMFELSRIGSGLLLPVVLCMFKKYCWSLLRWWIFVMYFVVGCKRSVCPARSYTWCCCKSFSLFYFFSSFWL